MRLLGVHVPHPTDRALAGLLDEAKRAELSYGWVGATLAVDRRRASESSGMLELGTGEAVFERVVGALSSWRAHDGIGAFVHPADAPIEVGTTLLVVLRAGPFAVVAPDRVVAVVDEPDRFGFAYGTVAGHPESGEESFVVERSGSGLVSMTVRVDARPATRPARLAAPVVDRVQRWALKRYLAAVRDAVASP